MDGAVGIALVDYSSGMILGKQGGNSLIDMEVAGAVLTQVVRAKIDAIETLQLNDAIEDILVTLGSQYHIIMPLDDGGRSSVLGGDPNTLFLYLVLDRDRANLAMARHLLRRIEQSVRV
ncbi:hypothetical protein [Nocardia sp. alder85J]|uniref:hypothetical protein n=1 Tax=Nocardia sp. alder85J TaxID=2862949 RepID=UPI001CD44BF0|nr:hypothetical protein [Nocardia sp. alder85J]MCX4098560.1 hypothetical protein [Nocardia sp. alder85J]